MTWIYVFLLILYSILPPIIKYLNLKYIYPKRIHDLPAWRENYLISLLVLVSFLPILYFPEVDLGFKPTGLLSVIFLIFSLFAPPLGIKLAVKRNTSMLYVAGIYAGFMEEFLFRGIIFGLAYVIWKNNLIALAVSSLAFGVWHLKNIPWTGRQRTIKQFFWTAFVFGPIFSIERILMGDLSLAIMHHIIIDSLVALTPKKYRWFIVNSKPGEEEDDFVAKE